MSKVSPISVIICACIVGLLPRFNGGLLPRGRLLYCHKRYIATFLAAALLLVPPAQAAVYRIEHADGSVSYSDKPPKIDEGNVQQIELAAPDNVIDTSRSAARISAAADEIERNNKLKGQIAADRSQRLRAAQMRLKAARAELAEAQSPIAGDYIHNAGGGMRLSDSYYKRIESKQAAVEAAQAAIKAIYKE